MRKEDRKLMYELTIKKKEKNDWITIRNELCEDINRVNAVINFYVGEYKYDDLKFYVRQEK